MKHLSPLSAPLNRRAFIASAGLGAASLGALLAGCGSAPAENGSATGSAPAEAGSAEASEGVEVHVASLKGPTSIGLVTFMDQARNPDMFTNSYDFQIMTAADEILPLVIKGDIDIALIPANAASVLYNKTEQGITCLDINTLGVLSVVTGDTSVTSFEDLEDRTVYLTGKGTTPEYTMNYLLDAAGIADSVTLEFKSEAAEVVSVLAADATAVGVLPQPFVTAALTKNDALSAPVDLTDVWARYAEEGSQLVTGVTVVRNEFLDEHPQAVTEFVVSQAASVDTVNDDPATAAPLVVEAGIIDAEPVAEKAIPACHLVCITGSEMQEALSGYLKVLYDADPASVGGALPEDLFYTAYEG
ncbi:ABC transporter substrate-binding protein [Collinsella tanakaei]|uniref:ABC transporter substrate-binding protein n=1 Tax=Collinsella tanakaei TaxID=626935 RepID=UPI0025A3C984|nr:ABC transporter substrate-binding protein [Collinsella tanakaei]MDM8301730.1 ABC transporter substrate-binding protein [Collinsella tanakaei]